MEKQVDSSLFINDGSFMERFKLLQPEEKGQRSIDDLPGSKTGTATPAFSSSHAGIVKGKNEIKMTEKKLALSASTGKLAFSLKQKQKIVTPAVKLGEEDEEENEDCGNSSDDGQMKRQKLIHSSDSGSSRQRDVAPSPPSDPAIKKVADKLASFVAKNGRQFEHITRQRNPGDTPFKFLFDETCQDYKYYEHRLIEEEKHTGVLQASCGDASAPVSRGSGQKPIQHESNYQMPASALYENDATLSDDASRGGESSGASTKDPIAMMEFYMNKAAQEERMRQPKQSKDEMPPPPSYQGAAGKKGHHMGDYIPQDELEKFLATCNDVAAQKAAREACERAKIQSDNVGHKLLSKMGWKEGEGLGSSGRGIADPIMAGDVKKNNLGVGAHHPGEVTPDDDIYEQYKKRMMLGYRYRPNPLNNPRKAYY